MFQHWPSIESFYRVRTDAHSYKEGYGIQLAPITYRGKVKLHGTNAGIIIKPNGKVIPQSRTRIISTGADNKGFAAFVKETENYWATLAREDSIVVVFGEWCGKGIMKGVSISQVLDKLFAVFAIQIGHSDYDMSPVHVEPNDINTILGETPNNVYVLPWYGEDIVADMFDDDSLKVAIEKMNLMVANIEACDPWVKEVFGINGLGEGIVFYPISMQTPNNAIPRENLSRYMFKAKGTKHKVVNTKESVQLDPEVAASIDEFVDQVVTEGRLEQAVTDGTTGIFDKRQIGPFIAWFSKDVKKDVSNGEVILPDNIEWKLVAKAMTRRIQKWYMAKVGAS